MAEVGKIELQLNVRVKPWVKPLMMFTSVACAVVSFMSDKLAHKLDDCVTSFIIKRGVQVGVC